MSAIDRRAFDAIYEDVRKLLDEVRSYQPAGKAIAVELLDRRLVGILHAAADREFDPPAPTPLVLRILAGCTDEASRLIGQLLPLLRIEAAGVLLIPDEGCQ